MLLLNPGPVTRRNTPFTPAGHAYYAMAEALREFVEEGGRSYERLHDALKTDGFVIYAGQDDLAKSLLRISTMGQVGLADISRVLTCCAELH